MKTLRSITEDQVWCEFLKSEYSQRRSDLAVECSRLTTNPDFTNDNANNRRKELLWSFRWPIMATIPRDTSWEEVGLTPEELLDLYVLGTKGWLALSDGSSRLRKAAENLLNCQWSPSIEVLRDSPGVSDEIDLIRSKVSAIQKAQVTEGHPIIIRQNGSEKLTVVDGYHRMVALFIQTDFLRQAHVPPTFYMGTSKNMTSCLWLTQ